MSTFKTKRPLPERIGRIGILTTAAIGDTILIGAVVSDLRCAYPTSSISLFAGDTNYAAGLLLPGTNSVIRIPVYRPLQASRRIRQLDLDLLLDFGPWPRLNAVIARLSGARFTMGFRTLGQYRHYGYDRVVDHSPAIHEFENHRRMTSALGIATTHIPEIDRSRLPDNSNIAMSSPYLLFHLWPGGRSSREKEWPIERWARLAGHFIDARYGIVLTGAPSQRAANERLIEMMAPTHRIFLRNGAGLSLAETAALAARARLVVSVDTGTMHLAAALGAPVIALHGPSSSKRWGPIGSNTLAIDSPEPRAGYLYLGFEVPTKPPQCMESIEYDRVLKECLKMLKGGKPSVRAIA
jgi:heptosyltransferase III